MRPRTLLVLVAVVLGLGAFIWFYERELPSSEERTERAKRVLALAAADVDWLAIEWQGKKVRLEREAPTGAGAATAAKTEDEAGEEGAEGGAQRPWRLTEPLSALADRWAVERLVESLVGLEKERTIADPDRRELGLEVPRARVTLGTKQGERVLEVGADVPASTSMVVAVKGEAEAAAVPRQIYSDLTKEPGDWRSHDLFTGQREDIERLSLTGPGGRVLLAKRGDGFWVESPVTDRADRDQVNELLGQVTGLRVHTFLDQAPRPAAELGLQPPRGVVEVILHGREEPFRVEVGAPVPDAAERSYARAEGLLFETEAKLAEPLARTPAQWRSLAWTGLEVFQIDAVKSAGRRGGGEPLTLERAGADWQRGTQKIAYAPVSDFLYAVAGAKGEQAATRAEAEAMGAGFAASDLEIVFTTAEKTAETLSVFPPLPDGRSPATSSARETVLLLSAATVADVQAKLEAVRKAEPVKDEPEAEGADGAASKDD